MPYKRGKVHKVELKAEDHKVLEKLAMRHKLSMKEIAGYLIVLCDKYDLMDSDWEARLLGDDEKREDYTRLEGSCPALIKLDETYVCLWGQENAPPKIKKLTKLKDQLEAACEGCTITRDIANKIRSQEAEIRTLRAAVDVGIVGKIPQCKNGGRLKDDNKMWCPTSGTVKIKHCMTLRGGQPCNYMDMIAMSIKGELPNPDDMK